MTGFKAEIENNILPFWLKHMTDAEQGGFYGRMDGTHRVLPEAGKGAVLNARLLWTFSAAYRVLRRQEYLAAAERAFAYLSTRFYDPLHKGFFWELDYRGRPVNTKKQTYAQAFALYGLSEYYRASGDKNGLELAVETFGVLEKHADKTHGGYFEAFSRDWGPLEDVRLSEKDINEKKSMNTHLHVLEAYTNLRRVWESAELGHAHRELTELFPRFILDKNSPRFNLFFDEAWTPVSRAISYGHDIEGAWLLHEAAETAGIPGFKTLSVKMAEAALEAQMPDGGIIYEKEGENLDKERHWWVQAEAVVGYMYAWKNSGHLPFKTAAEKTWAYIREKIIDPRNGEWFWSRLPDGTVNTREDKAGFWKCPYHNGRMCLEMIENFGLE